jgi:hypothetical protein
MLSVENTLERFSSPIVIELLWLCCQLRLIVKEEMTSKKTVGSNNITCRKLFICGYELEYYSMKIERKAK